MPASYLNAVLAILICVSIHPLFAQSSTRQADYLIRQVRLFDGLDLFESMDVAIRQNRIVAVAVDLSDWSADTLIDGQGKTLLPGLINAHVHLWFPAQLQQAAKAGVLTVLDMHGSIYQLNLLREMAAKDSTMADYFGSAGGATVPGGHGTQYGMPTPTIDSVTTAAQFVLDRAQEGVDYIKILREPSRPTVSYDQIDTVVQTAHEQALLAVAHISRAADVQPLVERQVDGFVHMWSDSVLKEAIFDQLESAGTFVVPTALTVLQLNAYFREQGRAPEVDSVQLMGELSRLIKRDILLVAGTDPPNFNINYGSDLYKELALFVQAGMTPQEALATATGNTAKAFQFTDRGRILPGYLAHLVLIDGNPTAKLEDLAKIDYIWKNGKGWQP